MLRKARAALQRGFSLVEVLVALAILGFVVLAIVGMFSRSVLENASGYDYAKLASVGRQVVEDIQARPWNDPAIAAGSGTWTSNVPEGFEVSYVITDYRVQDWNSVLGTAVWPTPAATATAPPSPTPAATPAPDTFSNVKKITLHVRSTRGNLLGRRDFTVTAVKIPNG